MKSPTNPERFTEGAKVSYVLSDHNGGDGGAETEGFEPSEPVRVLHLSRVVHSAGLCRVSQGVAVATLLDTHNDIEKILPVQGRGLVVNASIQPAQDQGFGSQLSCHRRLREAI